MDLLCSLCSAAHFPPKSHLKLFQFRTRDARRRIWVYFEGIFASVKLRSRFVRLKVSDSKRPIKIEDPEGVLKEVYGTLRKSEKYEFADDIHKRIIVGGDDVVNWILGVICDLNLPESPSIVPISHGTENNIPLSFGWVGHLLVYESILEGINYFSSFVVD